MPRDLESITTYSHILSVEVLKNFSDHFTRTELYFEADGLVAKYHCSIDNRIYRVKITASP